MIMANKNKPFSKEEEKKGFKDYGQGGFKDSQDKFKKTGQTSTGQSGLGDKSSKQKGDFSRGGMGGSENFKKKGGIKE